MSENWARFTVENWTHRGKNAGLDAEEGVLSKPAVELEVAASQENAPVAPGGPAIWIAKLGATQMERSMARLVKRKEESGDGRKRLGLTMALEARAEGKGRRERVFARRVDLRRVLDESCEFMRCRVKDGKGVLAGHLS
jgi:hypothetical protein